MNDEIKLFNMDNYREQFYSSPSYLTQNSNNTIVFDKLLHEGFDWGGNDWNAYTMSDENVELIRNRINQKIINEYRFREIGSIPGRFKVYMQRTITEAVTAQGLVYEKLIEGLDLFNWGSTLIDEAVVRSEFPQSKLNSDNDDYASYSDDRSYLKKEEGNNLQALLTYINDFNEPDAWVVKQCEKNFSMLGNFTY